nr:hypothetical protein [Tanacetum cinerariifolium]
MDNPNIAIEEYIRLEEETARQHVRVLISLIADMAPLPPRDQRHLWLRYQGLTLEMRQDLAERLRILYTRVDGQEIFMSHAWRRLFEIREPLVHEFILEFFSTCKIGSEMRLDVTDA